MASLLPCHRGGNCAGALGQAWSRSGRKPRDRVFDRAMERRIGVDHLAQHADRHAGMDRNRERAEDLAACGPGRCRPGQHAGASAVVSLGPTA